MTARYGWVLVAAPLAFLGYFFVYPVARILGEALSGSDGWEAAPFFDVFTDRRLRGVAWFTLWQAALSTVLTVIVAMPGAYVLARYEFPGKRLVRAAVTVPFMLPTLVVGSAFLALFGSSGALGISLERTVWAILIAHVFFNYAVVVRTVGGLWAHLDPSLEEAARMLGASRWRIFREVTLPLLGPALAAASSIIFLFTLTSFGVILVLGGPRLATVEVEIYRQATAFLALDVAAALAIVQLLAVAVILIIYSRYQERRAVRQRLRPVAEVARRPRNRREQMVVGANLGLMAILLGGPLLVLVERALRVADGYGIGNFTALGEPTSALLVPPVEALRNSLGFALAATALALTIGLTAAVVIAHRSGPASRWFDTLLMLPLGTSAVTIGFGLLLALDWPLDIRTSPAVLVVAQALVAIPFVVRAVTPVMRSIQHRLREAAAVLGAAPGRVWREVDLPIVGRAALVGAGFAAAISLGEFGATAFVVRPDAPTLPVAIFRLLSQPGAANFGQAMAMSVILMILTAVVVLAIDRFRAGEIGEF